MDPERAFRLMFFLGILCPSQVAKFFLKGPISLFAFHLMCQTLNQNPSNPLSLFVQFFKVNALCFAETEVFNFNIEALSNGSLDIFNGGVL